MFLESGVQVIDHMLDIALCPGRPQYTMASGKQLDQWWMLYGLFSDGITIVILEYPLLLYECSFEEVKWINQTSGRSLYPLYEKVP